MVYNINISSTVLRIIMISLLRVMRNYIAKTKILPNELEEFAIGFIIKDLIGDGTVILNKTNKGLDITISEQDLKAQNDIKNILKKFNISTNVRGIKINLSTNFKSCLWYFKNNAFFGHIWNRKKLLCYILNNYYFICLYNRLKNVNTISIKDFMKLNKISYKAAEKYLRENKNKGFLNKNINKFAEYSISNKGRGYIKLIDEAIKEYNSLSFHNC